MENIRTFPSTETRNEYIITELNNGKTIGEVSRSVGLTKRQIKRIKKAHQTNGRIARKRGSGRRNALSKSQKLQLLLTIRWNFAKPLSAIVVELGLPCTVQTARNYLHSKGYSYKKTQKRPYLSYQSKQERLAFAESYQSYPFETTIFVDESVFRVGEPCYGWSPKGHIPYREISPFPPSVSVWAAISYYGKLNLAFYEGNLDQFDYQDILQEHLYPQANALWGQGTWLLAQDGATCHTAETTIKDIHDNGGEPLDWPPASPDLNPLENVWHVLKNLVYKRNPTTERHLRDFILEEWNNLPNNEVIQIAESFPRRLIKLRESNGEYTGY